MDAHRASTFGSSQSNFNSTGSFLPDARARSKDRRGSKPHWFYNRPDSRAQQTGRLRKDYDVVKNMLPPPPEHKPAYLPHVMGLPEDKKNKRQSLSQSASLPELGQQQEKGREKGGAERGRFVAKLARGTPGDRFRGLGHFAF
eukprot:TRINITY_DN9409_c0_g1_i2.p1 TRINITY_DN9409_c0_g1~~TRINITY_DN9409_c0_g1_i2.p1  ORF type:complete len:143 (+),score=18.00 TRINITY_DN9409_c0_g1_i2:36-464(+)